MRRARRTQGIISAHQLGTGNAGFVVRRLGTVRTVLRAATALDVQEHRPLNLVWRMMLAVNKLCLKDEVDEGRAVNLLDFAEGPVVTHDAPLYWPRTRWLSLPEGFVPSYSPENACPHGASC